MRLRWVLLLVALPLAFVVLLFVGVLVEAGGGTTTTTTYTPGTGTLRPGMVPAALADLIQHWGDLCTELTPGVFAAQLYQESGLDPNVGVSSAGAVGIAQFLPSTFTTWVNPTDGSGPVAPTNPTFAIPAAARLDCSNAKSIENAGLGPDVTGLMLAAYNAGLGAVEQYRGVPPFAQTQNYVRNIEAMAPAYTGAFSSGTIGSSQEATSAAYFAYARLGTVYQPGPGATAAPGISFDDAALTQAAYASVGVSLPAVARDQWFSGPHIPTAQLQTGDLVFLGTNTADPTTITHVGIYIGGGQMIDAPSAGAPLQYDPVSQADYFGATRPLAQVGQNGAPTPTATA